MEHPTQCRVRKVPANEFIPLLEMVESGVCALIDVRSPDEFRKERIEGARNVPVDTMNNGMDSMDRDTPLLIYCKIGKRCIKAVELLSEMGFEDVTVLDGGIDAWKAYCRK
jgi:rhodanese-related sulfurtransferase